MFFLKRFFVGKKFSDLYIEDYNNHKIVFNTASNDKSFVVLDNEQWEILNLIDGKLKINSIIKKLKDKIPERYIIHTLKYLEHRNIIQIFNKEKKPAPINTKKDLAVLIETTSACNFDCKYCFVDRTKNKYLDFENGKKYIEKCFKLQKKYGSKNLSISFSGGEPLLNLDVMVKLTNFINTKYKKYNTDFILTTNGSLIDEKTAKILKDLDIKTSISIDGLEENCSTRTYINGLNAYNDIMRGYNNLKSHGVAFGVNIVINPFNTKGLQQFIEFLAKDQTPFTLMLMNSHPMKKLDFDFDIPKLIREMKQVYTFIRENLEKYPSFNGCELFTGVSLSTARFYACCVENHNEGILLSTEGDCTDCFFNNYGHILDKDIKKKLKKTEPKYNIHVDEKENCKECNWKYVCAGGCPLTTYAVYKTTRKESPYCEVIKELISELLKIEAEKDLIKRKQGIMC